MYNIISDLVSRKKGLEPCGKVTIFDDGSYIYLRVVVWTKPWLAWGELDKNGDGKINRYDLKSDGITITGLGDHGTGKNQKGYAWKVDSRRDGSPSDRRACMHNIIKI